MHIANKCPACDSTNFINHGNGQIAPFVAARTRINPQAAQNCSCNVCGLWFSSVRFDDEEVALLYDDYRGPTYNAEREIYEPGYTAQYGHLNDTRDYMDEIEHMCLKHLKREPERVLDIGGNDGKNTPFADNAHIDVWDVSDSKPSGKYDVVVMAHVLEHVSWPRDMIAVARQFLAKNGIMYIEVPVENVSIWWHEHIQCFNPHSLYALTDNRIVEMRDKKSSVGNVRMVVAK